VWVPSPPARGAQLPSGQLPRRGDFSRCPARGREASSVPPGPAAAPTALSGPSVPQPCSPTANAARPPGVIPSSPPQTNPKPQKLRCPPTLSHGPCLLGRPPSSAALPALSLPVLRAPAWVSVSRCSARLLVLVDQAYGSEVPEVNLILPRQTSQQLTLASKLKGDDTA